MRIIGTPNVLFPRINRDVVQIDNTEIINIASQSVIDVALEGRRSIGQAHWHNQELIVSIAGSKGGFPFISFLYSNSIVNVKEIEFAEDLGVMESIWKFTNQWNRVSILNGDSIKASIVYTKSQGTILLERKYYA
jgi:hypothetical protein